MNRPVVPGIAVREATHVLVLKELVGEKSARFVLKGGVNLRLFAQSPRYSQDMDLDGHPDASDAIRAVIRDVVEGKRARTELRRSRITRIEPGRGPNKDTEVTFRYKFRVISAGIEYATKVEVSFREPHPADESEVAEPSERIVRQYLDAEIALAIPHYTRAPAVRQKVVALAARANVQARDVFDLHVLGVGEDRGEVASLVAQTTDEATLAVAHDRAMEMSYEEFEGQVLEFLDDEARDRYGTPAMWDAIRLETASFLDGVRERQARGDNT